jgi:hypothetical protein
LWKKLWTGAGAGRMRALAAAAVAIIFGVLGHFYGYARAAVGVVMFLAIAYVGIRWVYSAVSSQPEPEPTDVSGYGLKYVCRMCGLELKVEVAAKDSAPRHCMEPMELVRTGGKPPLRPV